MEAESSCNPQAHNKTDNHRSCIGSYGLMQVGCLHTETPDKLMTPEYNIEIAYKVYKSSGWNAWSTYKKVVY